MAQLKDIKTRLISVKSTQKITLAMMMLSSAKLRKSQNIIQNLYPYKQKLSQVLRQLLSGEESICSPFTVSRTVNRVALVAFSSNTGLVGRFNNNISAELASAFQSYLTLGKENILIYTIGTKAAKAVRKMKLEIERDYSEINVKPDYDNAQKIAVELMDLFLQEKIDRVELIYHRFYNKGLQVIVKEQFLPFEVKLSDTSENYTNSSNNEYSLDYIIEPDRTTILEQLIPQILKVIFFTAHIDSATSEHASRMKAMQIASDNADELIEELTRDYNKLRQESITNELLDIMGGVNNEKF